MNEKDKELKEKEQKQKKINTKYTELQMFDQQIRQLQQQAQVLQQQASELELVKNILDELTKAEPGSESFVTITPGILVKAKIEKVDEVLLNVGSGTMVEKNIPDTKKILDKQINELRKTETDLIAQLDLIIDKAKKTEKELSEIIQNV
ncbi:prefoldin subunit alpha [Candidatus Woesearchaeota archaeon ex4484_78]|nr:MAG: prefoldin subunit alpha [Candidatus Woesearchaeota archaeon ex4484_78]